MRSIPSSTPTNKPLLNLVGLRVKGDTSASSRGQERLSRTARGGQIFSHSRACTSSSLPLPQDPTASSGPDKWAHWWISSGYVLYLWYVTNMFLMAMCWRASVSLCVSISHSQLKMTHHSMNSNKYVRKHYKHNTKHHVYLWHSASAKESDRWPCYYDAALSGSPRILKIYLQFLM